MAATWPTLRATDLAARTALWTAPRATLLGTSLRAAV